MCCSISLLGLVMIINIIFAFIFTGLTWLMVYRTEKYQKLKAEVEKQSKKCMMSNCII